LPIPPSIFSLQAKELIIPAPPSYLTVIDPDGNDVIGELEDEHLLSGTVIPRAARKSVTSDLFHQWLQSGPRSGMSSVKQSYTYYVGIGLKLDLD
jgi:hypothetical protein